MLRLQVIIDTNTHYPDLSKPIALFSFPSYLRNGNKSRNGRKADQILRLRFQR